VILVYHSVYDLSHLQTCSLQIGISFSLMLVLSMWLPLRFYS